MKFEHIKKNHVKFTFTVTPAEFEHALEHAFAHIKDETRSILNLHIKEANLWAITLREDDLMIGTG